MKILKPKHWFRRSRVIGSTNPSNPSFWVAKLFGGGRLTAAGIIVDQDSALKYSAVWSAVNIISGAIGFLPLPVYKRVDDGKERVPAHPVYRLLHDRPNRLMTPQVFRETLQAHILTWGNGYAEIERNGAGRPIALWPITPDRVQVDRDRLKKDGILVWKVSNPQDRNVSGSVDPQKSVVHVLDENMLHIPGLGFNGIIGYSVIEYARESIGLGMAAEQFGSAFFGNGASIGTILETPNKLSVDAQKRLKDSIRDKYTGVGNAHRTMVLEEGLVLKQGGIKPKDAQFLQTREFQITDVARWFQIAPHMLGDLKRATFSNIEQQGIEFVTWTLGKWLKRWEHEVNFKLFSESERNTHFAEFMTAALLRGDTKSRFEAYNLSINGGWMNRNEVRTRENMNTVEGLDEFLTPMNMAGADNPEDEPVDNDSQDEPDDPEDDE